MTQLGVVRDRDVRIANRDISEITTVSKLWLDATSVDFKGLKLSTGEKSGDTITAWLVSLHLVTVWGLPYRMFVCVLGLVISILSITGVYIWFKKRRPAKIKRNIITSVANLSRQDN
jgi:uncharacterized iron-regulated membrane protein